MAGCRYRAILPIRIPFCGFGSRFAVDGPFLKAFVKLKRVAGNSDKEVRGERVKKHGRAVKNATIMSRTNRERVRESKRVMRDSFERRMVEGKMAEMKGNGKWENCKLRIARLSDFVPFQRLCVSSE